MTILACYVSAPAFEVLQRVSADTGRSVEELAESAIEEAAIAQKNDDDRRAARA